MVKSILSNTCIICKEEISTQICPSCLSESMRDWLVLKKLSKEKKGIDKFLNYLKIFSGMNSKDKDIAEINKEYCKICRKSQLEICPNCFTKIVQLRMREEDVSRQHIEEFKRIFLFNTKKEAEKDIQLYS